MTGKTGETGTTVSCPHCGTTAPVDQRYCGECGTLLRKICVACGTENRLLYRFCGNCGTALDVRPQSAGSPTAATAREERRWATVLFADISGFTAMSEHMDPEDVKIFADGCARRMSDKIQQYGGMVLRVLGDEVLAVFGAPVAHEDDAERAMRAALALRDLDISGDPDLPVQVHAGVNTGEVMAGLMGPDERRDYTVMGDVVNTAARLRSAAAAGSVLVGEATYRATRRVVRYREVAPVEAKGKDQPVRAWEALEVVAVPEARPLGTAPLIGRNGELERLEAMWQRVVREQQPHLVTILGEPGIGKSRLVAELLGRLPEGVATWQERCLPYGEALGYSPLAGMLKQAARVTPEDNAEEARARLEQLVVGLLGPVEAGAEVARHLALLSGLDLSADREAQEGVGMPDQRVLHNSMRQFVEAAARQRPLCLIVDDIQWADTSFLELLESIAARVREASLLLITLARPELTERRPAWGSGVRSFTAMTLEPLGEDLERELVMALSQQHGLPPSVIQKIGRSAGGNPLFAEEMVAMIAERGPEAGVPSVIKMLIAARLDALPPLERNTIQLAAVLGKVFWAGGVAALGAETGNAVRLAALLESLEGKDLLRMMPRSRLRGEQEVSFKHDLIRDVAYEMLPRAERRVLHSRAVAWLEGAAAEQVDGFLDQLAHHAVEAGDNQRAIHYLVRAAERASRVAAHRQAAALLAQAINLAEQDGEPATVAALRAQRGEALISVGLWDEARLELEAALAAMPSDDFGQRAQTLLDLSRVHLWALDIDGLRRYANETIAAAEAAGRVDLVASALGSLTEAESLEGNLEASVALYETALARSGSVRMASAAGATVQGLTLYWLGRYTQAIPHAQEAVDLASGHISNTIENLPNLGLVYAGSGHYADAEQVFADARRFGREHEIMPLLARAIAMSAGWRLAVFDLVGHEAVAQEARELAQSVNFVPPLVSAGIDLVLNYARRGEVALAEQLWPEIEAGVTRAGAWHRWLWRLRVAQARAEVALARGAWEEARQRAAAAIAVSQGHGRVKYVALALLTRAEALTALGRKHEAIPDLRRAVELTRPTGDPAMMLRVAAALLAIEGDDNLLQEAQETRQRILAALPDEAVRQHFEAAEPVRLIARLA